MEPERVRAYLQAACAGLGFEIGEVWWTSNEKGSSTVAAIEEPHEENALVASDGEQQKKLRFVQLYTSKSFENRRSELVNPPESGGPLSRSNSTENLDQHVLSPRLVDAISQTAQVVWANTRKQEGLTGRSDIPLHTAVGMPVAVDEEGNMCIVVMFSPHNIQSTDDAMDYLQSITHSATSSSIPCLLPVFDPKSGMNQLASSDSLHHRHHLVHHPDANSLGEGVTARFVSLDDPHGREESGSPVSDEPEVHCEHELSAAPKDTFGIPMLPSFAELGSSLTEENLDVFDEASYGIWATIMETLNDSSQDADGSGNFDLQRDLKSDNENPLVDGSDPALQVTLPDKAPMPECRRERLEEFCSAFLGMSVFDLADVWVPASGNYSDCLRHVMSVSSTMKNELLNEFSRSSENTLVKMWTGAVGRAYSSGNPVWSANPDVFIDGGRAGAFKEAKIQTVLAVPVFSGSDVMPACVVSCYSLVRSGSVPFVLRFVQQALRLLWTGLDKFEPHESVDKNIWHSVAPADLGEMAADVEMQHHFMTKKRPHNQMSDSERRASQITVEDPETTKLAMQLQSVQLPSGETITVPLQLTDDDVPPSQNFPDMRAEDPETTKLAMQLQSVQLPSGETIIVPLRLTDDDVPPSQNFPDMRAVQTHISEAIRSVQDVVPFDHVDTNPEGTKRAHVMGPIGTASAPVAPLPMPQPLPTQVVGAARAQNTQSVQPPVPSSAMGFTNGYQVHQQQPFSASVPAGQSNFVAVPLTGMSMPPNGTLGSMPIPASESSQSSNHFCIPTTAAPNLNPCRIQGCDEPAVSRRPYCQRHSGNRLCEHPGCPKCAQGSTRFCIAHGGGRRCTYPGCDKGARDKFFCAAHGGGKRCKHEGCTKSAVGGSNLCTAHGGGRRCAVAGCDKSAQSSTKFCVKHGGGKKCAREGCQKVARGRTLYCAAHGGGVRCKLEGCNRVAIGRQMLCRAHGGGSRTKKTNGSNLQPQTYSSAPESEQNVFLMGMAMESV